jgi:hypothetical protein
MTQRTLIASETELVRIMSGELKARHFGEGKVPRGAHRPVKGEMTSFTTFKPHIRANDSGGECRSDAKSPHTITFVGTSCEQDSQRVHSKHNAQRDREVQHAHTSTHMWEENGAICVCFGEGPGR